MDPLTPAQRRDLRAKAHHLDPVVIIGQHGLTPAVLHEIDLGLIKHELIKLRVLGDDRDARNALLLRVCTEMDCAHVQSLGKVLVLWRPNPEKKKKAAAKAAKAASPARRSGKGGKKSTPAPRTAPRTPLDPVRARRRNAADDADTTGGGAGSGRGRRGAARFAAMEPAAPIADAPPAVRRKSSYTPKTTPKSFSAKPNPRSAWERKKSAANTSTSKGPAGGRRRRTTGT